MLKNDSGEVWWALWVLTKDDSQTMALPTAPLEILSNLGESMELSEGTNISLSHTPLYLRLQ